MKSGLLYGLFFMFFLLAVSSGHSETNRASESIQSCQQIVNHQSIIPTVGISAEKLLPALILLKVIGNVSETSNIHFSTATLRQLQAKFTLTKTQRKAPHIAIQFYTSETDDSLHLA